MSISTKRGDKGRTSLYRGGRVAKDSIRLEICGALDELSSYLSISKSLIKSKRTKNLIKLIQQDLFVIGTEIVTKPQFVSVLKKRIDKNYVNRLDGHIKKLEGKKGFKIKSFCLPGENLISSSLDVARATARRAERKAVTLKRRKILKNSYILTYLNRLSDLLYLIARSCEKRSHF